MEILKAVIQVIVCYRKLSYADASALRKTIWKERYENSNDIMHIYIYILIRKKFFLLF